MEKKQIKLNMRVYVQIHGLILELPLIQLNLIMSERIYGLRGKRKGEKTILQTV